MRTNDVCCAWHIKVCVYIHILVCSDPPVVLGYRTNTLSLRSWEETEYSVTMETSHARSPLILYS